MATTDKQQLDVLLDNEQNSESALEKEQQETNSVAWRLPFSFAKRYSVLLSKQENGYVLHCLSDLSLETLLEVRRIIKAPFSFDIQNPASFEFLLTEAYQRDSSEAQQMMEDIGNEVDLYSLADEMIESEDLLENEDDAPIIKLINAMLS